MIDWSEYKITEPPMTMNIPFEELPDFVGFQESDEPIRFLRMCEEETLAH